MAFEDILEKIEEEGEEKIQKLDKDYKQKIDSVSGENKSHADDLKKLLDAKIEKKVKETRNRILTSILLEERKRILKVKTDSIKEVLSLLREKIMELSPNDMKKLFRKVLLENLESGNETIIIDKKNQWFDDKFLQEIKSQLKEKGISKPDINIKKEADSDFGNGIMIKSEFYEINLSIDSLIKEREDYLKKLIAKELFEEKSKES